LPIEEPKLDAGLVRNPAHHAIQGVDLANEMALPQPADCRVAGHLADRVAPMRDQGGARSKARGGGRGFAPGMASADDNDVVSQITS
jgi:hypothetical protein